MLFSSSVFVASLYMLFILAGKSNLVSFYKDIKNNNLEGVVFNRVDRLHEV